MMEPIERGMYSGCTPDEITQACSVKVVGVCWVLHQMQADALWQDEPAFEDPYAEESFRIFLWCLLNDAVYYAAPKERFSEPEARLQAVRKGRTTVVVEDMS